MICETGNKKKNINSFSSINKTFINSNKQSIMFFFISNINYILFPLSRAGHILWWSVQKIDSIHNKTNKNLYSSIHVWTKLKSDGGRPTKSIHVRYKSTDYPLSSGVWYSTICVKKFAINLRGNFFFIFCTKQSFGNINFVNSEQVYIHVWINTKVYKNKEIERKHQIKKKRKWIFILITLSYCIFLWWKYVPALGMIFLYLPKNFETYHLMQTNIPCYGTGTVKLNMLLRTLETTPSLASLAENINSFFYHQDESEPNICYKRALKTNSFLCWNHVIMLLYSLEII